MTYITKRCGNCGYTHRVSVYGYVHDPIGIRIVRCPSCGSVSRDSKSKEWIQMSTMKKYFSIHPRAPYSAFFLGIILIVPFFLLFTTLFGPFPIFMPLSMVLAFAAAHYFLTVLKVNSKVFCQRYCDSILRTRNDYYRNLLAGEGTFHSEEIPRWVLCSKKSRQRMETYLRSHPEKTNFSIPTLAESVRNV